MTQAIMNSEAATSTRLSAPQMAELFSTLVLNSDLSKLSEPQRVEYYKLVCERVGLDPYRKPFDLILLQGKLTMYPNKECTAQLTAMNSLSVTIIDRSISNGLVIATARVHTQDGTDVDDIGVVPFPQAGPDAQANAIMKAVTKAKRRAILSACGLGMVDESELETITDVKEVPQPQIAAPVSEADASTILEFEDLFNSATTAEEMTAVCIALRDANEVVRDVAKVAMNERAKALGLVWKNKQFVEAGVK